MDAKPFYPEDWPLPAPGEVADASDDDEPTKAELMQLEIETAEDVRLGRTIEAHTFFEQLKRRMPIAS